MIGGYRLNILYKLLLTINSTSWMLIVYVIKKPFSIFSIPYWIFHLALITLVFLSSGFTLFISKYFGNESLNTCKEISLADNEFLPVYLGYFFVSLSISDSYTMAFLYALVFLFTFLSQTQYFNPIYLLFGYHYYHVLTSNGTKIFIIRYGKVIRNSNKIEFQNLRRLNDTTFIERR